MSDENQAPVPETAPEPVPEAVPAEAAASDNAPIESVSVSGLSSNAQTNAFAKAATNHYDRINVFMKAFEASIVHGVDVAVSGAKKAVAAFDDLFGE